MKRAFAILVAAAVSTAASAHDRLGYPDPRFEKPPIDWSELPKEVRDAVLETREACRKLGDEEEQKFDQWQGISFLPLKAGGQDYVVVDHRWLCNDHIKGGNCSNRGCDVWIYEQVAKGRWRKVFDEHLYDKSYVVDYETNRLQMMVVSIYANDPRCHPKKSYGSGAWCNLIVTHKDGKFVWQKITAAYAEPGGVLPPREFDALGCFTRTYDRAHLARHPDQVITAVKLHIYRPPPGSSGKYWFLAQFRLRGKDETLRTGGTCGEKVGEKASGLWCVVECDGGGVDVVPRARAAMMSLDRIRVAACGENYFSGAQELTRGKDDRVFRLDRVDDAACAGMEPFEPYKMCRRAR